MKLGGFKHSIPPGARDSLALQLDNFGGIKGASVGLAAPKGRRAGNGISHPTQGNFSAQGCPYQSVLCSSRPSFATDRYCSPQAELSHRAASSKARCSLATFEGGTNSVSVA